VCVGGGGEPTVKWVCYWLLVGADIGKNTVPLLGDKLVCVLKEGLSNRHESQQFSRSTCYNAEYHHEGSTNKRLPSYSPDFLSEISNVKLYFPAFTPHTRRRQTAEVIGGSDAKAAQLSKINLQRHTTGEVCNSV
jgi:hypothetical protein